MSAYKQIQRTVCLALVALLVMPAPALRADEITTLTAVADATLQQSLPTTNDGATAVLRALGESNEVIRTLARFDLSSIASSAAVKVANLKMKVAQAPTTARNQAAHRVTGTTPWTEGGVTWTSRDGTAPNNWGTAGGDIGVTAINTQSSGTTVGATINWSILSDGAVPNIPQDWVTTPANNQGLLVKDATETDPARAVVKTVYSGTLVSTGAAPPATLSANLGTCSGATPTVNINKSFLIFQGNNNSIRPNPTEIRGRIVPDACPTTPPTVQFFRVTNETSTVNLNWYVVEFARGVSVQRGTVASQSSTVLNAAITPVSSLNQAFLLWSKTPASADGSFSQDDPTIGDLTALNNVQFRVNTSNVSHTIDWEVVEFTNSADASIQRGTTTAMTSSTVSVTLSINPVDPAKSFPLVGYRIPGGSGSIGRLLLRGRLSNCTATCNQLIVDRSVGGATISEIGYQVVTLNNGSTVQSASTNFATGVLTQSPVLSPTVDTTRSIAFTSTLSGGGVNFGRSILASPLAQSLGVSAFTMALAAASITLTRGNGNDAADASWYVAELNNADPIAVSYNSREDGTPANRPQLDVSFLRDSAYSGVVAGISDVTLNITFPAGATVSNYDGSLVARKNGASTPTFTPNDGTSYTAGTQPVFGETVISSSANFAASPTVVSIVDENGPDSVVSPSTQYSYKTYTRDNNTITGAAIPAAPHYSFGAGTTTTTGAGGGASKNWSYKTAGTALAPPGLNPGNKVIAASNDNNLHSMSTSTGARNYKPTGSTGTTGGAVQSRPAVIAQGDTQLADCDAGTPGNQPCDISFVGSNDGRVYAFNAITGQLIWSTPAPGNPGALVAAGGMIQGGIAVQLKAYANGAFTPTTDLVIVGTREISLTANKVYALNGSTGAIVWTFSPGNMDAVNSTPAVDYANNTVWVSSLSNGGAQPSLWKINSVTGAAISNFSLGNISGSPTISLNGRVVYVVTDTGNLAAVRNDIAACTNTLVTGATSGNGFPIAVATGALSDNIFFATTTAGAGTIRKASFAYNVACGGETFAAAAGYANPSGIGTLSTPIWNPFTGFIYAGSSNGNLYKIDPANGSVAGTRTVNAAATIGDPALDVFVNRIYVGDSQGRIYSFDIF
ncbi:MAG: PQQ-binding-like beta-propeller repeat protein [Acidobacteria bacterium]|nr:PQQ-binding-like beta-propeller repeat protein [Acidobacteriota bacterium]